MRYIVIGAGAIGGTIGGRLAASGHEVVLVARGAHLDALRARGLRLATPHGTSTLDIPAVAGPGELGLREDDVLLLATKTQDAEPANGTAGRTRPGIRTIVKHFHDSPRRNVCMYYILLALLATLQAGRFAHLF